MVVRSGGWGIIGSGIDIILDREAFEALQLR